MVGMPVRVILVLTESVKGRVVGIAVIDTVIVTERVKAWVVGMAETETVPQLLGERVRVTE